MFGKKKIKAIEEHLEKFKVCHHCEGLFLESSMKLVYHYSSSCFDPKLYFCNQHTPNYDQIFSEWDGDKGGWRYEYSNKKKEKRIQIKKPNPKF